MPTYANGNYYVCFHLFIFCALGWVISGRSRWAAITC